MTFPLSSLSHISSQDGFLALGGSYCGPQTEFYKRMDKVEGWRRGARDWGGAKRVQYSPWVGLLLPWLGMGATWGHTLGQAGPLPICIPPSWLISFQPIDLKHANLMNRQSNDWLIFPWCNNATIQVSSMYPTPIPIQSIWSCFWQESSTLFPRPFPILS